MGRRITGSGIQQLKGQLIAEGKLPDVKRLKAAIRTGGEIPPPYRDQSVLAGKEARPRSYDQEAITPVEYSGLQEAYDHFNSELFDGQLPDVFITYQRHANSAGHFSPDRFAARVGKFGKHELALNPDGFIGRSDKQICSTLGHEQHHVWQQAYGKPSPRGYHNKEWAAKIKANGLQPSSTGMVGGRETGQRMAHYIVDGGKFDRAFDKLKATGWKLNLQSAHRPGPLKGKDSKTKFSCAACGQNAWGKPELAIVCELCGIKMRSADAVVVGAPVASDISYDPQVAAIVPSIEPPPQNSAKRKRGRPKGSKNKKPETVAQLKPKRGPAEGKQEQAEDCCSIVRCNIAGRVADQAQAWKTEGIEEQAEGV
jgi:hypothetical protein